MKKQLALLGLSIVCGAAFGTMAQAEESQAAKYTITKNTKPCNSSYQRLSSYNSKTRNYYTIKSYLEKLKSKGGGTLVLKKGTYKVCSTIDVPKNVTIQLKKGVKIKKTSETGSTSLKAGKVLFQVSSPKAKKYKGKKNIVIKGAKNTTIDLGKVKNAVAIDMGHNYKVTVSGIKFRGKNGGTYINVAASRMVKIENCTFQEGTALAGDKYQSAITVNSMGSVPSLNVKIWSNTFSKLENGVASTKYKKNVYTKKMSIRKNTFKNMSNTAVLGKMWDAPTITSNTVTRTDGAVGTSVAFKFYSVTNPEISKNTINWCQYAVFMARASKVNNSVSAAKIESMKNNTVSNLYHYYVLCKNSSESRLLYFQTKADKDFVITPETKPYREHYTDYSAYSANGGQTKTYFMLRSYMEQLEYAGGGNITLAPGTYTLSHSVCIPSNVTLTLSDGATVKKVKAVDTNLATNKTMFEIVPPSKEKTPKSVGGYNGSQNVVIQGMGTSIIDCANVVNAMGIVMGHANNVTIRNIAFVNEYGSHFMEMNSSQNVTVENCSFTDFRIYDDKSHKEAINIDTADANNNGFNYEWTTHDRTACSNVMINNCMFTNMGTAIGSHTYSVNTLKQQIYHENVTIQNCKVNQTYNAAIRAFNWRNAVIKNNLFTGVQGLEDNKGNNYTCVLLRGVVNPTVTGNTFAKGGVKNHYAIVVYMLESAEVDSAVNAGYPDTVSEISEQNKIDMQENTVYYSKLCNKKFLIKYSQLGGEDEKILFNHIIDENEKPDVESPDVTTGK